MTNLQSFFIRSNDVSFTQISQEEIVILSLKDNNFYHLNESAVDLWLSLEIPKTSENLAQLLADKYAKESEAYKKDVVEWVEDNLQKGLLTIIEKAEN
ncbi:MAG: hypothetical protein A3F18_03655 [Legionellales bacterium RIFCSPHIGHO2_12_FULL_37_14]|nr:MAG: hypothetical protein A3F18_03655 [Legionellales bacterium RIFCSPHIGHO2_12_FULL_37_14]